jgi:hypothetical protein
MTTPPKKKRSGWHNPLFAQRIDPPKTDIEIVAGERIGECITHRIKNQKGK